VALTDGRVVTVERAYLEESLLEPTAKVVAVYSPAMPSFRSRLSERDRADLLHYLASL
jgi:cytochrome c oxidase subunit 2